MPSITAAYSFDPALDMPKPPKNGTYVKRYPRLSSFLERCTRGLKSCWSWFTRCLSCFKSGWWLIALCVCASLLACTWWIVVPFVVDAGNMNDKFAFTPLAFSSYSRWKTALQVLIPCLLPWIFLTYIPETKCGRRVWLSIPCVVYIILLVIGNVIVSSETEKREAFEQGFAVKFNAYYCDVRTVYVCLEGSEEEVLVLTRGNDTTVKEDSENATDVAYSVWTHCKDMIEKYHMLGASRESEEVGTYDDLPIYEFLDHSEGSRESDAWCGDLLHRATPPTDKEQLEYPAPYASNQGFFEKYTREWKRSMVYSNAILGSMVACMALAALSAKDI